MVETYLIVGGGGVEKGSARGHFAFGTICLSKPRLNRLVYFFIALRADYFKFATFSGRTSLMISFTEHFK